MNKEEFIWWRALCIRYRHLICCRTRFVSNRYLMTFVAVSSVFSGSFLKYVTDKLFAEIPRTADVTDVRIGQAIRQR